MMNKFNKWSIAFVGFYSFVEHVREGNLQIMAHFFLFHPKVFYHVSKNSILSQM
jgi:hypothetical protein